MARILIVEDEREMGAVIKMILESGHHQVVHVLDGIEALKFMGLAPPDTSRAEFPEVDWISTRNQWTREGSPEVLPDLVLTDCMMPHIDGLSLANMMLQTDKTKDMPVIVLTSKKGMEEPFRQLRNVKDFIHKPPYPAALLEIVAKALPTR